MAETGFRSISRTIPSQTSLLERAGLQLYIDRRTDDRGNGSTEIMSSVTAFTSTDVPLLDPPAQEQPATRTKSRTLKERRAERKKRDSGKNQPQPEQKPGVDRGPDRPSWANIIWVTILHLGALAAPFYFSWEGVALLVGLHWLTGGIGICLGFHRMLTHTSFNTYRPIRYAIAFIGGLAGEGSAIDWVSNHRKHHALSDHEGDPHSPVDGAWWSHVFWLTVTRGPKEHAEHNRRWAPDIMKDPGLRLIAALFLPSHFLMAGLLIAAGYAYGGTYMAISFLTWGLFARLIFVMHSTWLVNSASHMWGYRNYETTDLSRNNWWVALITYGEGWHNNHHAYPRMALHGHRWWEVDVTFTTIRLMQWLGLAWDVVDYKKRGEKPA